MDSGVSAILLDAGGVLVFPGPEPLLPPLTAAGVSLDGGLLERAHYRAMMVQDCAARPPASGSWWREYLIGFVAACGVAEHRCAALAAEIVEATTGQSYSWTHVGSGVPDGLRALAAFGLPMGVVSNSDGTVAAELRRLGLCYAPDGREPAGPGVRVGVVVDSAVVGVSKPDPAIFRIALDALGVPPSKNVLHVGDSLRYDVTGAQAAGLQPVHLDPHGLCPAPEGHPHIRALADLAGLLRHPALASPAPRNLARRSPPSAIDYGLARPRPESESTQHALVQDAHPDAARGPGGRRRAQPSPAAARRLHPPADGRALFAAAARPAGPAQGHRDHP